MVDKYIKYFNGDLDAAFPLIAGSIGLGTATEFVQWSKVFGKLPDVNKIIDGSYLVRDKSGKCTGVEDDKMPKESDVLYALSAAIVAKTGKADKKQLSNVLSYLSYMSPEYATITVKDMIKLPNVSKAILELNEWVEWSSKFKSYIL